MKNESKLRYLVVTEYERGSMVFQAIPLLTKEYGREAVGGALSRSEESRGLEVSGSRAEASVGEVTE